MDFSTFEIVLLAFSPLVGLAVVGTVVEYFQGGVQ
jgi:hypothetical protein